MPVVYRAECESCGKGPATNKALVGWVTFDGREGGVILPESYLALKLNSGELACLPHPLESSTLRGHGYSWSRAAFSGRLFRVTYLICTGCGTINEQRQIETGAGGCSVGYFTGIVSIIPLRFLILDSWWQAIGMGFLLMVLTYSTAEFVFSRRWSKQNAAMRLTQCNHCQTNKFITVGEATKKLTICPQCGENSMRYSIAGKA